MSDWFKPKKTGLINHYCGGVPYSDEPESKTNKVRETQTKQTRWFYPVETLENGALKCTACLIEVQKEDIKLHEF